MYVGRELDITIQFNDGPEVPVHLSSGLLGACSHVMRSSDRDSGSSTAYDDEIRFTIGIFDCHHTNEHGENYGKSVWITVDYLGLNHYPNDCSGEVDQILGKDFDEGKWEEIELAIPLPQFRQYSVEPKIERPPLKVRVKRIGELVVRKFEVSGHRRHRVYTPIP